MSEEQNEKLYTAVKTNGQKIDGLNARQMLVMLVSDLNKIDPTHGGRPAYKALFDVDSVRVIDKERRDDKTGGFLYIEKTHTTEEMFPRILRRIKYYSLRRDLNNVI